MSEKTHTVDDDVRAALTQYKEKEAKEAEAEKKSEVENKVEKPEAKVDEKVDDKKVDEKEKGETKDEGKEQQKIEEKAEDKPGEKKPEDKLEEKPDEKNKKPIPVPWSLKSPMKSKWSELSPEWQEEIARIDKAGAEGYQKVQDKVKYAEEIENEIRPYESLIRAEGGTHVGAVRELLRTAAIFRMGTPQQKQAAWLQIAQQFAIPFPQQQQEGEEIPPYARALAQQIQHQNAYLQQLQGSLISQRTQETQAHQSQAMTAVDSFLGETDDKGTPRYLLDDSHLDDFSAEIALQRQKHPELGHKQVLEKAYENLSWKVPEIRAERLKQAEAKREEERKSREADEMAKKKQASGSLKGSAAPNAGKVEDDSVRGIVSRLYHEARD